MKDMFKITFMILLVIIIYLYRDNITNYITDDILYKGSNKVLTYNEYFLNNDYIFVQNIDSSSVKNYQELLNIFYTTINSGDDSYSFYCKYNDCINDVSKLIEDNEIISDINNFVHPFNSFSTININVESTGRVTIKTKKVYNSEEINFITNYINDFIESNINNSMTDYDKIKVFHDFIINNTIYDENFNKETAKDPYTAYNLITTGKSICGGYSDIMSIYLNIIGIQNYKITSPNHVWNLIKLDNKWYHLDSTWDDPVASDGKQYLLHNFFLISTDELLKLDTVEHNFNKNIYKEAI